MAEEIQASAADEADALKEAYRRILARGPGEAELLHGRQLLASLPDSPGQDRWILLAQALLTSNEFLFVD